MIFPCQQTSLSVRCFELGWVGHTLPSHNTTYYAINAHSRFNTSVSLSKNATSSNLSWLADALGLSPSPPTITCDALLWVLCALTFILGRQARKSILHENSQQFAPAKTSNVQEKTCLPLPPSTFFLFISQVFEQTPATDRSKKGIFLSTSPGVFFSTASKL